MAQVAGTFSTYDATGIREDLSNVISNISPEDTPFMSNAGKGKAEQTFFEWQQDSLSAPDGANVVIEADDVAYDSVTPTVRVGNYTQISDKSVIISGTEEVVNKAGRKSELAYQIAKKAAELKRDQETMLLANQGAVAGSDVLARRTAGLGAFVKTNDDFGATGASPVYTNVPTAARTDGTQRAATETILKNVIQLCWAEGASPKTIMVGAWVKQVISGFAGIATKTFYQSAAKTASIIGAADVYVSDFGTLSVVPNRFQRGRDGWVLDFDLVKIKTLRPYKIEKMAKTGDAEKRQMLVEYGLQVVNEKGLGLMADLATS